MTGRARRHVAGALAAALLMAACSGDGDQNSSVRPSDEPVPTAPSASAPPAPSPTPTPPPLPTLPSGFRSLFPEHRLVGFSGGRSPAFGRLDVNDLPGAAEDLAGMLPAYAVDGRLILPVFELIATVAHSSPTSSGLYRTIEPDEVIQTYLDAAREHDALLLLNLQPGRADFLDEVKLFEKWLVEPDVGLALDPEWAVDPGEVPGRVYGRTDAAELNAVAEWLSALVKQHNLPEKVLVFHQVHESVVQNETSMRPYPGVAVIKSVDGIGLQPEKEATWSRLMPTMPRWVHSGFKLFFDEDTRRGALMTPEQVLALRPLPEYVLYE